MSTFKSFALVGANGYIGKHILKAFLAIGVKPLVITRKTSNTADSLPSSLPVAKVDLDSVDEVAQALKQHGVEVVVSAIGGETLGGTQQHLADASKKAGVKLFVPSEYGLVTEGVSPYPWCQLSVTSCAKGPVRRRAEYLKSIGLPWARVFTGLFAGYVPWLGAVEENGKFNVEKGKGDSELTVTNEDDIGGFIAYVLTTLPSKELEYRAFRISGENISLETAGKRLNKEVEHVDAIPGSGPGAEFRKILLSFVYAGHAMTSWDHATNARKQGPQGNDNHLWAGHEWKKL
ncbi:hypothetical protein VNI00_003472 [Paramarasmius palmivorus]|uniref:NmrA-like domain-containing protein n=1 Tax=Paramarasmius palmivorus TaxID=297713 RepID=A0AAW0DSV2_9AGAR